MKMKATARPMSGARTMNTAIFDSPSDSTAENPDLATAAPTIPPTRAWDDELGSPM